ncbi:uncharacterized protein LOC142025948 [Buteo buteo]|uniref:uncharacterized protein LOC142025948 n=1 Tax=Buteo buteo TaxID=30397 RepID=UPI003EC0E92D
MEPGLGLEERTARLLRRSEAILSSTAHPARPHPRGRDPRTPETPPLDTWVTPPLGAEPPIRPSLPSSPAPGDPLLQWRLRRRGVESALGVSPWGGASLGSASWGAWEGHGSQDALRREPCLESCDAGRPMRDNSHDALRREPCLKSRDAQQPMRDNSHDALRREPCLKSHDTGRPTRDDSHDALRREPCLKSRDTVRRTRDDSHDASRREPCLKSRDARRPTRDDSHDASRRRAPSEERGSQDAPRREPCLKSRDTGQPMRDDSHDASRQEPRLKSRDSGGRGSQHAPGPPTQAPCDRAVGQDAAVGDVLQRNYGSGGGAAADPLLQLLRGRRRALRGRLRAVETLLAALQDPPQKKKIGGGGAAIK